MRIRELQRRVVHSAGLLFRARMQKRNQIRNSI